MQQFSNRENKIALVIVLPLGSACERYMKVQLFGPVGLMK